MRGKLAPAFRCSLRGYLKASAVFYLVMAVVLLLFILGVLRWGSVSSDSQVSFAGYGVAASVTAFVLGIASLREDLRLLVQNGVSRRTAYYGELLTALTMAAVLAAGGEVLTGLGQLFTTRRPGLFILDLYQIIYLQTDGLLPLSGHLMSGLFNMALALCACLCGMFLTLLFWRLPKPWKIAVGVGIPLLLNGTPWLLFRLHLNLLPLMRFLAASPWHVIAVFLLFSGFAAGLGWLLLRRAIIRAGK